MATKLYVGNLAWSVTDDTLNQYFAEAGAVTSAQVVTDKATGRSRGFGFVEMSSDEEAQNAIQMFHGKEWEGRALVVNEARPMEDRPKRREFGRRDDFKGRGDRY